MKIMQQCLAVGGAGFAGALARWGLAAMVARLLGTGFPYGTLLVNLSGSLALGYFYAGIGQRWIVSDTLRLAIATGFLGAFTTFSTLMYESDALVRDGAVVKSAINLVGSVLLGLLAVRMGVLLAR